MRWAWLQMKCPKTIINLDRRLIHAVKHAWYIYLVYINQSFGTKASKNFCRQFSGFLSIFIWILNKIHWNNHKNKNANHINLACGFEVCVGNVRFVGRGGFSFFAFLIIYSKCAAWVLGKQIINLYICLQVLEA